jgi:pyrroloquinoline quinone biosynthesis protein B
MQLNLLGAAAGGGVPQWNCCCINCEAVRSNPHTSRSHSQLAVSGDGQEWLLVNASPDLREQLFRTPSLHPRAESGVRNTPVAGVILTSADLDHILGLLLMREFTPVSIFATESVLRVIESNDFFGMLRRMPGQQRTQILNPGSSLTLFAGMTITTVELPGNVPAYVPSVLRESIDLREMTLGLIFESDQGKRAAYLPALPALTPELLEQIASCDVLLVDGTLWSEDELQRLHPGTPSATQMGHLAIGGAGGSLAQLKHLKNMRRIYTHINNSNPILTDGSPEQKAVLDAGFEIAFDGMEIVL